MYSQWSRGRRRSWRKRRGREVRDMHLELQCVSIAQLKDDEEFRL
jgi:hypothetical protein